MNTTATLAPPIDPTLPARASSWEAATVLARVLARRTLSDRAAWSLPVTALAIVSALAFSVAGGVSWFHRIEGDMAGFYSPVSLIALVLLMIPLATLAGAAARLAAARRDTRLSSLRLLGATTTTVRALTLLETAAVALAGALIGVLGYLALMPLFGLLHFNGGPIGPAGLWLGVGPLLLAVAAVVLLTVVSAALGLRQVEISPLGVRTRQAAPRMHWLRLVVGAIALGGSIWLAANVGAIAKDAAAAVVLILVVLAVPMLAVNLIGPWLLGLLARWDARRARTPVALLAARTVLDSPKAVWRQVGGLAMISFVAVVLGAAFTYAPNANSSPDQVVVLHDIRTGTLLTLGIAFVTVACSVGITQAATILDRRSLHVGLDMLGMPTSAIDAARRRAVLRPLVAVIALSAVPALLIVAPLAGSTRATDPLALATTAGVLAAGVALVGVSLLVTRRTLVGVIEAGVARAE